MVNPMVLLQIQVNHEDVLLKSNITINLAVGHEVKLLNLIFKRKNLIRKLETISRDDWENCK